MSVRKLKYCADNEWRELRTANILNFQRTIKEAYDLNSRGDRNYPWLPEGWGKTVETTTAK